jgi:hypothetical protein
LLLLQEERSVLICELSDETGVAGEADTSCGLVRDGEETYEDGHTQARTHIQTTGKPRPKTFG